MTYSVALAMLQRDGCWLLQLRDDIDTIIYPGHWGLFGGHVEAGEAPEQAVLRELEEEIGWCPVNLQQWINHSTAIRTAHVFVGELQKDLHQLELNEGQDMVLATAAELRSGRILSPKLKQTRPLAPTLTLLTVKLDAIDHSD